MSENNGEHEQLEEAESDQSSDERTNQGSEEVFVERTQKDVLCGRGVQILRHIGNLRLHLAANELKVEYMRSRRNRKKEIIETIVAQLKSAGSRFLKTSKTDKKKWVEADDEFAYHKVSHVLRGLRTSKAFQAPPPVTTLSEATPAPPAHAAVALPPPIAYGNPSYPVAEDSNGLSNIGPAVPQSNLAGIPHHAAIPPSLGSVLPPSNALQNQQNLNFLLANGGSMLNNNLLRNMPAQLHSTVNPRMTSASVNNNSMLYAAGLLPPGQNNLLFSAQLPQIASMLAGSPNFAINPGFNRQANTASAGNIAVNQVAATNTQIPLQANMEPSNHEESTQTANTKERGTFWRMQDN
jgi:hypothetical protein